MAENVAGRKSRGDILSRKEKLCDFATLSARNLCYIARDRKPKSLSPKKPNHHEIDFFYLRKIRANFLAVLVQFVELVQIVPELRFNPSDIMIMYNVLCADRII